jgi:hypothetical protein
LLAIANCESPIATPVDVRDKSKPMMFFILFWVLPFLWA